MQRYFRFYLLLTNADSTKNCRNFRANVSVKNVYIFSHDCVCLREAVYA